MLVLEDLVMRVPAVLPTTDPGGRPIAAPVALAIAGLVAPNTAVQADQLTMVRAVLEIPVLADAPMTDQEDQLTAVSAGLVMRV
tara:strand:+ start:250 stop:501 length:252 start_codon:yes stop_codon:yes gene_type:complete